MQPDGRRLWIGANDARKVVVLDARLLARLAEFRPMACPSESSSAPMAVSEWEEWELAGSKIG